VRRLVLFAVVLVLAGCGGSSHDAVTTTAPPALAGVGRVLYQGSEWAVAVEGTKATAYHLTGGRWRADRSGEPKIDILGPKPGSKVAAIPQVAFEVTGKTDIADTAMWVDGVEVPGKGGGLTPKRGTVYGAPGTRLKPGTHVAVAYGRTAVHATAVAWTFHT
jgi:hypothetical protein